MCVVVTMACGVRVCLRVQGGWSCLLIACQKGHLEVVKYLCSLKQGKELMCLKWRGQTPLDIARQRKHTAIVSFLESQNGA